MHCEEFELRLNDLVDLRRSPANDADVAAHACACAACNRLLRDYESLLQGIAALPPVPHPVHLAERVSVAQAGASRRRFSRRALAGLALAATVLVAGLPALGWLRSAPRAQHEPVVEIAAVQEHADSPLAGAQSIDAQSTGEQFAARDSESDEALVDQMRETYEPLVAATGESLSNMLAALPLGGAPLGGAAARDLADQSSAVRHATWEGEFASSMGPVGASASRSVMALLRVFPSGLHPHAGQGATP